MKIFYVNNFLLPFIQVSENVIKFDLNKGEKVCMNKVVLFFSIKSFLKFWFIFCDL
jgi:hypothetical protein